jgi:hypothetical protein
MVLYKVVDLTAALAEERRRICRPRTYNKRQRKALLTLLDLFEAGEFGKCEEMMADEEVFPYDTVKGYSESEHIAEFVYRTLHEMRVCTYIQMKKVRL